jgi:OmpA-OmpF porin, OOP family
MFEQLVNETAARFALSTGSVSVLMRELQSMMTNERTGGAEGFVDLFRRAGFGDIFTSWFGGKEGRKITPSHLGSTLGASALDRMADSSGLTRMTVTSALAFMVPKLIGRLTPNGVFPSSNALRSQLSSYINRPAVRAAEQAIEFQEREAWGWLAWAAAAALALFALLWLGAPAGTIKPELTVSNRDGKVTYSGLVRDEATRTAIVTALRTTFGEANIEGNVRIGRNVKRAAWLPRLGELSAAVKTPGVELSVNGNVIGLGGWLSTADRQALTDRLRAIFGTQAIISSLGDAAVDAVRVANVRALSALGAIGTSGVAPDALVRAMNLAVINFRSGSAEIPTDSMAIIRKSAAAMKRAPTDLTIEIRGHTDNMGDPVSNLSLSQARADAVKAALVNAGVPATMLTTNGYGDTRPRRSNDTEYGRFQNRRIEYAVVH